MTMITPSYLGETIEYSSLHACRSTLEDPTIPKAPARNVLDIKIEDYLHVARATHKIAAAARQAFNADGITVLQANEPAGGQVVFHLHVHVMPRHDGVQLLPAASRKEDVKVLESNATKLAAALKQ